MKKTALLLILALIFSQNAIYSAAIEKVTESRGYISASAEKDKDVYPNVAEITFTKENTAKSIDVASQENKAAMSAIQNALSAYQNENTEIRTGSYSATPNYVYKNNKKQLTGYTVINSITVKTKSTDKLGKMVDAAIKAGADRVGSLSFSYQNDGTVCKDLIFQATKEAQEIANLTAKTTNQMIKGVNTLAQAATFNNQILQVTETLQQRQCLSVLQQILNQQCLKRPIHQEKSRFVQTLTLNFM